MRCHAFFFAALSFLHRALCAFAIPALALADMGRFLGRLPRVTLFFPPKISMAELMLFNWFVSFEASLFNADRMFICPPRRMYHAEAGKHEALTCGALARGEGVRGIGYFSV